MLREHLDFTQNSSLRVVQFSGLYLYDRDGDSSDCYWIVHAISQIQSECMEVVKLSVHVDAADDFKNLHLDELDRLFTKENGVLQERRVQLSIEITIVSIRCRPEEGERIVRKELKELEKDGRLQVRCY